MGEVSAGNLWGEKCPGVGRGKGEGETCPGDKIENLMMKEILHSMEIVNIKEQVPVLKKKFLY